MKEEPDELQLPSPPQRRLSRSSIDLRDLEQQQHEKVTHTDSAPSIIVTDNFNFEIKKKSANSLQPLLLKDGMFIPPLDCLNSSYLPDDLNKNYKHELDIMRDDDQLARFIEDNFFYYKKQSSQGSKLLPDIDDKQLQQNQHIGALSESDFVTYQNQSNCEWHSDDGKQRKNSKQKMLACSDSDFIVSYGSRSKKLSLKSRLQFARSLLTGAKSKDTNKRKSKLETPSPNNGATSDTTSSTTKGGIFFRKGKFGMLSRSCNGCYNKPQDTTDNRSLQRVLSEGNNKSENETGTSVDLMEFSSQQQPPAKQHTAVDIFLKLIDFESSNEKKSNVVMEEQLNNFNYELMFNRKYENYCDQLLLLNLKTDNTLKMNSLCDISVLQQNVISPKSHNKMSKSEQLVLINRCVDDKNSSILMNSVQSSCNNLYSTDHVFVNSFVLNSPPPQAVQSSNDCSRNSHFSFSPTNNVQTQTFDDATIFCSIPSSTHIPAPPTLVHEPTVTSTRDQRPVPQILAINEQEANNNASISLILLNEQQNQFDSNEILSNRGKNCNSINMHSTPIIKKDRGRNRHSSVVTYDINVINNSEDISPTDAGYSGGKQFGTTTNNNVPRPSTSSASKYIHEITRTRHT